MQEIVFYGEEQLKRETGEVKPPKILKINDRAYVFQYYGLSNATLLLGEHSSILIDAFDSDYYGVLARKEIEKITDKPVKTIFYTHVTHSDHSGGASAFADTVEQVIHHSSNTVVLGRQEMIQNIFLKRLSRQGGIGLSLEEAISLGLGPITESKGSPKPLPATKILTTDYEVLHIDGLELHCIAAPGETDDQMYVWFPEDKIICSGDNMYSCWPNLSALRGSQYRDVELWVKSIGKINECQADYLIPGHGEPLLGAETVTDMVTSYYDAINWVLNETLKGMDRGLTPDELVKEIVLPEKWRNRANLQEYYGNVEWSIRGIFAGYLGWFDGNPTHIGSLTVKDRATRQLRLFGGEDAVIQEILSSMEKQTIDDMQWTMELCDVLLDAEVHEAEARKWKAEACIFLGRMQVSANGRHYYLSCAKDLKQI